MVFKSIVVALATVGYLASTVAAGGMSVPFRYNWRFHYSPGPDDGPGPGMCSFAKDVGTSSCTNLEKNPNRFTSDDCRIGCCYEPTCMVWQQSGRACQWGGTDSVCTGGKGNSSTEFGGMRTSFQPVKTSYAFAAVDVDDKGEGWKPVDIPHDSLLNGTFTDSADDHHGYLPRNVSWYRKHFALPADDSVWILEFEGTFHYTQIWINGQHVMDHSLGYTAYSLRLDNLSMIKRGSSENVIAIRTDASYGSGHWYEGGGLRWDINLVKYNTTHIVRHAAYVEPQVDGPSASTGIKCSLEYITEASTSMTSKVGSSGSLNAVFTITSPTGETVGSCTALGSQSMSSPLIMKCDVRPTKSLKLWSVKTATLYTTSVALFSGSTQIDFQTWSTGFRNAAFSAATGVSLNGEGFKFRGFSHHDSFAGVGSAMPPRLDLFRVQAGRAVGNNVWRMSHNPYHPPLYDILDAVGVTVWDENRDLGPWYVSGMGEMVRRDRNHPSVLLWSFCNEFECGQNSNYTGLAFRNATRAQDTSRPTTSNINGAIIPGVDVQGFSHKNSEGITSFHEAHPSVPTVLSECCSCTSHRLPVDDRGPTSTCIREQNSPGLLPFDTGSLGVWTLFDYFGESHKWPDYACAFGQFDIAGSPKPHAYWYVVNWLQLIAASDAGRPSIPTEDVARLLDLVDQPDCSTKEGSITCNIAAISTAPKLELFVDGTSQGTQTPSQLGDQVTWTVAAPTALQDNAQCNFSLNMSVVQCKGLLKNGGAKNADECKAACCAEGANNCNVWQFDDATNEGCWIGNANVMKCAVNPGKTARWVGGGNPPPPPPVYSFKNLTVTGVDANGKVVATHTLQGSQTNVAASLTAAAEIPSPVTGTGSKLVLDGIDIGLVAVKLVDKDGLLLTSDSVAVNVTFTVEGPGRLIGVGSGNPADHAYQRGKTVATYAGTAKALVRVAVDCTTPGRDVAYMVDKDGHNLTTVVPSTQSCNEFTQKDIVVTATAGSMSVKVNIKVSDQPDIDGYLAVARSTASSLSGYTYMRDFVG